MKQESHITWGHESLKKEACRWFADLLKRKGIVSEKSVDWWNFRIDFPNKIDEWITEFIEGNHRFSPMKAFLFRDEKIQIWTYKDRLFVHCLFMILKNTFPYIIPESCKSTGGPHAIKEITQDIKDALKSGQYKFALRIDIRSYYSSINQGILLDQLKENFSDPLTMKFLDAIVTTAVDDSYRGVYLPEKGIPLRSSLSPFFGHLYLAPLDKAFGRMDVFYTRFVDDVIVLVKTKRQYAKAKRRLFEVLRQLKLEVSPQKTRFSKLDRFHFLGVDFGVSQNPQDENQVTAKMHQRSCSRALNKVIAMRNNAIDVARWLSPVSKKSQRYLSRWAAWWRSTCGWPVLSLFVQWTVFTTVTARQKDVACIGRGLSVREAMRQKVWEPEPVV